MTSYVLVRVASDELRDELGQRLEDMRDEYRDVSWADVEPRWNAIIANVDQTFGGPSDE